MSRCDEDARRRVRGQRLILPALLFGVVIAIGWAIGAGLTARVDRLLLLAMSPSRSMLPLALGLTWLGDTLTRSIIAAAVVIGLMIRREWRRAVTTVAVVLGGATLNSAIKALVMRPRPHLLPHLDHVTSSSFPSGHSANGAILYLALALLMPARQRPLALSAAIILILGIGLSRIALAVHWPTDVAAGWCLGAGWVLLWRRPLTRPEPVDLR